MRKLVAGRKEVRQVLSGDGMKGNRIMGTLCTDHMYLVKEATKKRAERAERVGARTFF